MRVVVVGATGNVGTSLLRALADERCVDSILAGVTSYLSFRSEKARKVLEGLPIVLVERGKLVDHNLKRERMTGDEVAEEMRSQQISSLDDVEWAILEANGSVSFIKKS